MVTFKFPEPRVSDISGGFSSSREGRDGLWEQQRSVSRANKNCEFVHDGGLVVNLSYISIYNANPFMWGEAYSQQRRRGA